MKLILIRHGEPDYSVVTARGYKGHGRDLAPLTRLGEEQARAAAESPLLRGAEFIVSSPYTRALHTAAIISKATGLSITVENDTHERIPDLAFSLSSTEELDELHADFCRCRGEYPPGETRRWETVSMMNARLACLYKYLSCEKIVLTAHGKVIRRLTGARDIAYGSVREIEFHGNYPFWGYVDRSAPGA